ncbi:MAG: Stk1 family PASTA domain-containing Ser/Thr kinase [Christensenellaceae bacterium]|nr:Stk1 family PASTA domain-containing Ser/Thr kinase [Christensenellaceae bacterium]
MSEKILAERYRLVEQIGMGGMAIVYRAIDQRTGHSVAVKVLKPEFNKDAEFVSRFQREAEAASKMTHHNIVNLLDVGMDGENRYLIMEYVQGKTLKEVIREKGKLSPSVAAQITIRILSALQHAHQNGIIHRDIKPQNILVHADGHIKVADFGIARMANSSTLTRGDSVMGSVHYFSPEQASGQNTDVTSDIYSVGVTLYEMLTGRVPFDGDNQVAIAMQHLHAYPEPIENLAPDVPPAIIHVCAMAMEKNPRYRYQSAREMATELRMALEGRTDEMQPRLAAVETTPPSGARQATGPQSPAESGGVYTRRRRPSGQRTRHRARWWLMTAVVAVVIGYGIFVGSMAIYERVVNSAPVADCVGMDLATAERSLNRLGLQAQVLEVNHPTISTGTVIMQSPEDGVTLRKGDAVVLTVSKGPAQQTMPKVMGMSLQDGITAASAYGLTLTVVERVVSPTVQADFIITQVPEAGTLCSAGDIVQVTVSGGVAYVPQLTGMSLAEARRTIEDNNLSMSVNVRYIETGDPALHNLVAEQTPEADTAVIQGTMVAVGVYRVTSMVHRTTVTLDLPASDSLTSVRVTLSDGLTEYNIYQNDFPANASRHPEVELLSQEAGEFTYRVYCDEKFAYQQQVVIP